MSTQEQELRKTCLIFGGSGFIGRNLVNQLELGEYEILSPSHEELELEDEVGVSLYFRNHQVDVVINASGFGIYGRDKQDLVRRNFEMFLNATKGGSRTIQIGSGAEYDKSRPLVMVREEEFGKRIPQDGYGLAKYKISEEIERRQGIVNLRAFGLFGPYEDSKRRFISNAILKAQQGLPIIIFQDVVFDYLYIKDFVRIVDLFIQSPPAFKVYNVCRGQGIRLSEIAKKINQLAPQPVVIEIEKAGLANEYTGDNSRLLAELEGFQFTPFDEALKDLYDWYWRNGSAK